MTAAGALAALAAAAPLRAQASRSGAFAGTPGASAAPVVIALAVPFVPQGELLCGGAAAAMVLRYHGERGAGAEPFAPLVRPSEGGIRTDDLAAELVRRGWSVRAGPADPGAIEGALRAAVPPIVLLESGAGRWHYVVVVGLDGEDVLVHDPARAPDVRISRQDFLRRWDAGQRWLMTVRPRGAATQSSAARPSAAATPIADVAAAEVATSPALLAASERFRARDWSGAAAAAAAATRASPSDPRAWRLLGGSLYLAGRGGDALDAWAHVGEPRIDGVDVAGLARTRHAVVHELLGLVPGRRLDRAGLVRARRRAALLPAAVLTSVDYRALPGGWAEVQPFILEGPAHPFTRAGMAWMAASAASGELTAWESGLAGAGERIEARWAPDADGVRLDVAAPGAFGLSGRTEAGVALVGGSAHTAAWLRASDWAAGWLRWEVGARADRWGGALHPGATGALHAAGIDDVVQLRVGGALWAGREAGALGALDLSAALGGPTGAWSLDVRGGLRALGGAAAPDLYPEAGDRGARPLAGPFAGADPTPLLRAHRGVRGSRLAHAGAEATRWTGAALRLGLATFADFAVVADAADADRFLDAGLGLRATVPGLPGALRVDHAWGLGDGERRWSLGWQLSPGAALRP